jgi:hypothetical protein
MKEHPKAELVDYRSHWVTLPRRTNVIQKEEVYLMYETEWRGDPVHVEVVCDRYSSGMNEDRLRLGEWRVVCRIPYFIKRHEGGSWERVAQASDTARKRIAEWLVPIATEWLTTDAYARSFSAALASAVVRELEDCRPGDDIDRVRASVETFKHDIDQYHKRSDSILAACEAYEAYQAALEAAKP